MIRVVNVSESITVYYDSFFKTITISNKESVVRYKTENVFDNNKDLLEFVKSFLENEKVC